MIVSLAVIVTRFVWVFPATYLPRRMSKRMRERDPYPPWQYPALIRWAGLRGAVSLAAALALPLTIDGGDSFPQRSYIIYLAFCVILATLVFQGLTLPAVIRGLRLEDDGSSEKEETKARIHAAEAALGRLEELAGEDWVREDTAERMRGALPLPGQPLRGPLRRRGRRGDRGALAELPAPAARAAGRRARAVVELRRQGRINDTVMNRVQRDLDLEDAQARRRRSPGTGSR